MTFDEIDFTEMPPTFLFARLVEKEFMRWEAYLPTTVEADIPFKADWWKYLYWMPRIKKDFYSEALKSTDMEYTILLLCQKYGMDVSFFEKQYKHFIKRMYWMRKNNMVNHLQELP